MMLNPRQATELTAIWHWNDHSVEGSLLVCQKCVESVSGIHRLNGLCRGFDSFFLQVFEVMSFCHVSTTLFVHLIVPDFTATLCDPFEGQHFKTSLSLRVEVWVHFECHGGYGICHWDWDPA